MGSPSAFAATAKAIAAVSGSTPPVQPLFHRIWPPTIMALGLGLTAAWICFLGYGLVNLITLAV